MNSDNDTRSATVAPDSGDASITFTERRRESIHLDATLVQAIATRALKGLYRPEARGVSPPPAMPLPAEFVVNTGVAIVDTES